MKGRSEAGGAGVLPHRGQLALSNGSTWGGVGWGRYSGAPSLLLAFHCHAPKHFPRKEVIQPQLPLQLPCYDFVPVTGPALERCLLAVSTLASGVTSSHDVTGGVYKARERIHRTMADARLLATPTSCGRVAAHNPNYERLSGLAPPRGFATRCTAHCSVCVALDIKAMLT